MFEPSYDHTQKAPWYLLLFALAALFFTVAWVTRAEPVGPAILVVAGLLMAMAGYSFQHLTVCDGVMAGDLLRPIASVQTADSVR